MSSRESPNPERPIRLHRFAISGHCHRVELLLSLLGLSYELIEVDLRAKEQKTPRFLALNPFGQVPVIEDGRVVLGDSNAILLYLSRTYGAGRFEPESTLLLAEQQRWFSVAAGPLAFGPAAARAQRIFNSPNDPVPARQRAHALFGLMNTHLSNRSFLLGESLTLADIANYAYTALAPEGGIELGEYAAVRAWLERIEATPRFIAMQRSP
jgi:glutathione S-transferase